MNHIKLILLFAPTLALAQIPFDSRKEGVNKNQARLLEVSSSYMIGFKPSTKLDKKIESETSVFYSQPSLASAFYKKSVVIGVSKLTRSDLLKTTIALYYISPLELKIADVAAILNRWDQIGGLTFTEYRWRTYVQAKQFGDPNLLVALKKIDIELKDNYYTQRLIVSLSGIRKKDLEYGLVLGKRLSQKYPDHADPQHIYGMILWDKAFHSRSGSQYELAIAQLQKALVCKVTTTEKKAEIASALKNIIVSKSKFGR